VRLFNYILAAIVMFFVAATILILVALHEYAGRPVEQKACRAEITLKQVPCPTDGDRQ
jgi:hypothetical protein